MRLKLPFPSSPLINKLHSVKNPARFLKLVFSAVPFLTLGQINAPQPPQYISHYQLVFADEFDHLELGTTLNGSYGKGYKWYEGVWFSQNNAPRENFSVANSALTLEWKRGQKQPDTSVATFSQRSPQYKAWRYGYFEARMKWRPEEGAWPAFWLIPVQAALGRLPKDAGEIDIFEGQGDEPHTFFGTIHHWKGQQHLASSSPYNHFKLPPTTNFADYHTYGLLWKPGTVTWYFDNVPIHAEHTYDVFDRQDYFIVIGMQEGAAWKSGDLTGVTAQRLALTVDWVRVWQLHSK